MPQRGHPIPEEKQLDLLRHPTDPGEEFKLAAKPDNRPLADELAEHFRAAWPAGP